MKLVRLMLLLGLGAISCSTPNSNSNKLTEENHYITVKPVIVRSDKGDNPAKSDIPESLIERVYQKAHIDFIFEEPTYLNSTKARDGLYSLDRITEMATNNGLFNANDSCLYMFFVNAIDGYAGPIGMGRPNGNIIYIALGDALPQGFNESIENMHTFIIAHEIGHCLGLQHAVDDPNVPNNIPNIEGDGAFKDRIDPRYSLTDYQIRIILSSPLIRKKQGKTLLR